MQSHSRLRQLLSVGSKNVLLLILAAESHGIWIVLGIISPRVDLREEGTAAVIQVKVSTSTLSDFLHVACFLQSCKGGAAGKFSALRTELVASWTGHGSSKTSRLGRDIGQLIVCPSFCP